MLFFHAFADENRVIGLFCLFFRQNATVNFSSKTVIVWSHFCTFLGQEGTSERTPRACLKSWKILRPYGRPLLKFLINEIGLTVTQNLGKARALEALVAVAPLVLLKTFTVKVLVLLWINQFHKSELWVL